MMQKQTSYIYRRNGILYIAYPDARTPSGIKRESTGGDSRRDAKRLLEKRLEVARNRAFGCGETNAPYTQHFIDFLKLYKEGTETHKTYKGVIKLFIAFLRQTDRYANIQYLHEFGTKVFDDYRVWLKETKHKDWTVKNHLMVLKTVFKQAEDWESILKAPKIKTNISITDNKPIVTLNKEDDFRRFFAICKDVRPEYYPHYFISTRTGMRYGEMVGLVWDDVHLDEGFIKIRQHKHFNPKGRSKRTGLPKERIIPLQQDAIEMLKSTSKSPHYDNVFLKDGKPISPKDKSFRRWLVHIAKKAGIQGLTRMHELRHTLGHQLGDKGTRLEVIKNILGHSDIRTTERYVGKPDKASEDAMGNVKYSL
jgi:integrase